MFSEDEMNQKS